MLGGVDNDAFPKHTAEGLEEKQEIVSILNISLLHSLCPQNKVRPPNFQKCAHVEDTSVLSGAFPMDLPLSYPGTSP